MPMEKSTKLTPDGLFPHYGVIITFTTLKGLRTCLCCRAKTRRHEMKMLVMFIVVMLWGYYPTATGRALPHILQPIGNK